jgi:FYVE zinc finger/WW domain
VEEESPTLFPPDDSDDDEELPLGWEVMHDPTTGKPFYVDHKRKITQWTRPKADKRPLAFSHAPLDTPASSAAMARVMQVSTASNDVIQPRSYFQEASYFQPAHSGAVAGEVDLSDSMPALDFAVKKVADKYRLECPHCNSLFTLSKRRHHCRLCGDVFCDACSSHRVALPLHGSEFEKPVRICDFCNKDVEQGNFFSMRRYLTPLTLYDTESPEDDEENGVATYTNVNAALAALTFDLDQILQNAEGFEEKITIPTNILVKNIIKHVGTRSETYERAIRALASLLSLGSMVGKSDYAHAVYLYGGKKALDQILWILERSGSDRRTLFVQEKATQVTFYLTESQVMSSVQGKHDSMKSDEELGDSDSLDIQRCLRSMIDHSSSSTNPNLQRWATATVRNLVLEDQRRTCLAINEVAAKVASGEPASSPAYESFLGQLVSTGGIMILCSLIGADDSDTRAHATGTLGAIVTATRAIDGAMSALAEMTCGAAGQIQKKDGEIVRAITAGSGFGSSVSQLLLSADNAVAGMGCHFVASLVLPILTDPEGSATLPGRYDCRRDPDGLGACREAALEIASTGCLPALISLIKENGRLTRPIELRCIAMETFAAVATAVGEMGKAWAEGKYEEGMGINGAPASLTRAVAALNEEQGIDVALQILKSSSVQSLGSQRDTPAARIREAAGTVLGAITSCSAEAILDLHSRQVLSSLILSANDSTMTAPSSVRGDNAPRCLGMLEAASAILMFSWQHPDGAESELLDRLIEALDVGAITYLFRVLTFKMDWESRDKSSGAMKARAAACRLACCLFGIALTDGTSLGMQRLMDSCDADQGSRRVNKGPRNLMEAVLSTLQTSLSHAHRLVAGGADRGVHYHAALLDLLEAALLATGSMCGSSMAPGGSEGKLITGDQFLAVRADEFESRRKEVCKVACDVVIRGGQSGPALLPAMMVGGFGEGAVGASLRLALSIAQNGSKDQHSKLAYSGILVPVSDILKAALSSGDIYQFSAALALVRFCGPHVASGTNGGIQAVRDAIQVATNVLTLPMDPGASKGQIEVQESLRTECVRSIESLSKNAALWSAISKDAIPSIIRYLDNSMAHGFNRSSRSDTRAAALRAVREIVNVPSHGVFAAERGLAVSLGKLIGGCHGPGAENLETIGLAMEILHLLVSRQESRRHCELFVGETLRSICSAVAGTVGMMNSTGQELATFGIDIIHCALAELNTHGDAADVLHSSEARFFVDSISSEMSFVRALCATLMHQTTGMELVVASGVGLKIPDVYGPPLIGSSGRCAGFISFEDACASVLFTAGVYASAIDSVKSEAFWTSFLALDQYQIKDRADCHRAAAVLVALFLSLMSQAFSGFQPQDVARGSDYQDLLDPLIRYRLLEALNDILKSSLVTDSMEIDAFVLRALVSFGIPRICLSSWQDPALLELSYGLLSVLVEEEPEVIQHSFLESKESLMSLFNLLTVEASSQSSVDSVDIRRFLTATLEELAGSGALTEAVEEFDIKSSAIGALAAACLSEEENCIEDEELLTSNRLSTGLMQCLVDLCKGKKTVDVNEGLQVKASEAVVIAEKLGKKICHMVISRFLERAKMQQYDIHDHEDVMTAPDVAMLCAIAQHEEALRIVRSIGGFHALAQVAGEGEISAIEAVRKVRARLGVYRACPSVRVDI